MDSKKLESLRAQVRGDRAGPVAQSRIPQDHRAGVRRHRPAAEALRGRLDLARCPVARRRACRRATSAASTRRWWACRWTSASPTAPARGFGPRAVRAIERIGPYHHVHRLRAARRRSRSPTSATCPSAAASAWKRAIEDIEAFFAKIVGGGRDAARGRRRSLDHAIRSSRRSGASAPVGLVHIDAHCDTGGPFEGSKFHHGGPFRQAVLAGVLDPERTIQIGIRGGAEYLWEFSYDSGMTVIHAEEFARAGHRRRRSRRSARSSATARPMCPSTSTASTRPSRPAPARPRSAA